MRDDVYNPRVPSLESRPSLLAVAHPTEGSVSSPSVGGMSTVGWVSVFCWSVMSRSCVCRLVIIGDLVQHDWPGTNYYNHWFSLPCHVR